MWMIAAACEYACTPLVHVWLHRRIGQSHSTAGYDAGHKKYRSLPADSLAYKALVRVLVPESNFTEAVPASKALLLRGDICMMCQVCWHSCSLQPCALALDPDNAFWVLDHTWQAHGHGYNNCALWKAVESFSAHVLRPWKGRLDILWIVSPKHIGSHGQQT